MQLLRNLQDRLTAEKTAWVASRDQEMKELEEKRKELLKLQDQVRSEQEDIRQQREHLFRTMEKLTNKGFIISPNSGTVLLPGQLDDINKENTEDGSFQSDSSAMATGSNSQSTSERKKESKWLKGGQIKSQLPINLISATNQQKVSQNVQVKQQIPLKLASRLSASGIPSLPTNTPQLLPLKLCQEESSKRTSGYQRLTATSDASEIPHYHSRTSSSPAMIEALPQSYQTPESSKSSRTQPGSKDGGEEEVIYF